MAKIFAVNLSFATNLQRKMPQKCAHKKVDPLLKVQSELEKTRLNLREANDKARRAADDLAHSQSELTSSERKKEDMRSKATEVVKL